MGRARAASAPQLFGFESTSVSPAREFRTRLELNAMSNRHLAALLTIGLGLALASYAALAPAPSWAATEEAAAPESAKPALPSIESLQLEPASLTLGDGRDGRQVLVWGVTKDGQKFDLTDAATFKP